MERFLPKLVFGYLYFKFDVQFPSFFKKNPPVLWRTTDKSAFQRPIYLCVLNAAGSCVLGCTDKRLCVQLRVCLCIRDFPCRLSNMCCHWETHWEDLLNLALTPETPTPTVLAQALCRTPLKPRRLNNEILSGMPLQPARLHREEKPKTNLVIFKREFVGNAVNDNWKQTTHVWFKSKIQSKTHANESIALSAQIHASIVCMFCVCGSLVAARSALAEVCYLPSDVTMLKTAAKVC